MKDSIKKFYRECKSAFHHGIAFRKMELGRYNRAVQILETEIKNNPNMTNIEYSFYSIGQCYFRMGQIDTALNWILKPYERYKDNIQSNTNFGYLRGFRDMLQLYCKVLRINNQEVLADKIINERDFGS